MKRIHFFEFEDFSWFPGAIREGITDYLQFLADTGNLYKSVIPVIQKGIARSRTGRIIDLCSGGGGGMRKINKYLKQANVHVPVTLTDKFPNLPAFQQIKSETNGEIGYVYSSVDATNVPRDLDGFRTMFVSFHHFRPEVAARILKDASDNRVPIGVFEYTEKTLVNFLFCLLAPVIIWVVTPFIGKLSLKKIIFTYIIPAIPFFTMWDGIVSILRTYTIDEMKQLTGKINATGYEWEMGRIRVGPALYVLYLLGYPANPQESA